MKKIYIALFLLFGLFASSTKFAHCSANLNLSLNVCQYRFNQDSTLVEIYYGITTDKLGQFAMELHISNDNGTVARNIWKLEGGNDFADTTSEKMNVDLLRFLLSPGIYHFKLTAKNISQSQISDSTTINDFKVQNFDFSNTAISDIEIAQNIKTEDTNQKSIFDKNRFTIIPNPILVFDNNNPQVYYYFEIYNLSTKLDSKFYYIKRMIVDGNGLPNSNLPVYMKKKVLRGNDVVEVGMFDISQIPSGKYFLNFSVLDTSENSILSKTTSFYVQNPQISAVDRSEMSIDQQIQASELAMLSSKVLEDLLGVTRYFSNDDEQKIINNLVDESAKLLFLYNYWKENDRDCSTPELESLRDLFRNIQYANSNFNESQKKGWQTDRGRIFLTYGRPSEIQYYANIPDFKEFQAWSYDDLESGVVFIFGVLSAFGDLKLIHSTKTGEIHNQYWIDLLKVSEGGTGLQDADPGIMRASGIREIFNKYGLEIPRYLK